MQSALSYPIELGKKETVESFGKCFIPKAIMKQEKILSGNHIQIQAVIDGLVLFSQYFITYRMFILLQLRGKRKTFQVLSLSFFLVV